MSENATEFVKDLFSKAENTALPESLEVQSSELSKGGVKRLLTPSPQGSSSTAVNTKRTRQATGESFIGGIMDEEAPPIEMHYLSQPIDPNDVTRIAVELKSLMLPEIKGVIKEFQESQPDLKALVDGAVKTLTEAFQKETSALKKENASLRQENKNLREAVSELDKIQGFTGRI